MYHPLALRMFLLGTHYRFPINYTIEQLNVASDRLYYTYQVCSVYILLYVIKRCVYELHDFGPLFLSINTTTHSSPTHSRKKMNSMIDADAINIFFWQQNLLGSE